MIPEKLRPHLASFAALAALLLCASASAMAEDALVCTTMVWNPGYIVNASRGDILLTRADDSPAGVITDTFGQYYTHSGVMVSKSRVRHNTADKPSPGSMSFWESVGLFALDLEDVLNFADARVAYDKAQSKFPESQLRNGSPGLVTNDILGRTAAQPWDTSRLTLVKLVNGGATVGDKIASTLEGISNMRYDVHSYINYDANPGEQNMCSGAVKYATDAAGYPMFQLRTYSASQVAAGSRNLFRHVYDQAKRIVDKKACTNIVLIGKTCALSIAVREAMATGVANEVIETFLNEPNLAKTFPSYWRPDDAERAWGNLAGRIAKSVSPDDLIDARLQEALSRYQTSNLVGTSQADPTQPTAPLAILAPVSGYVGPYYTTTTTTYAPPFYFRSCEHMRQWISSQCVQKGGYLDLSQFACVEGSSGGGPCKDSSGAFIGGGGGSIKTGC